MLTVELYETPKYKIQIYWLLMQMVHGEGFEGFVGNTAVVQNCVAGDWIPYPA